MGPEFRYEMAHKQRIILERRHSRRHFQTDPIERAASIPRNVGNRVSWSRTVRSEEAPCRRAHMAQIPPLRLANARSWRCGLAAALHSAVAFSYSTKLFGQITEKLVLASSGKR